MTEFVDPFEQPHEEQRLDDDDPDQREGGIVYVDEAGAPEEPPLLQTAADLLPPEDDPLSSLPHEEPDADTPPDDAAPAFLVVPRPGQSMPSVYRSNGIPVGVWLNEEHYDLDGGQVAELLVLEGMDGKLAAWYGVMRDARREADRLVFGDPTVAAFAAEEERRKADKQQIQQAFIKAHKERKT